MDDFSEDPVAESGDQAIPVVENTEQLIGNGLVSNSRAKAATASGDDDFSDDFEASASASLDQRKPKAPLVAKPQKKPTKPAMAAPLEENENGDSDDFADGEVEQPTEAIPQASNVAKAQQSDPEEEMDEEIDDEFSDGDEEEAAEVVVKESNVAGVAKRSAEEEEDDDFADGEVEEPPAPVVEESNVPQA